MGGGQVDEGREDLGIESGWSSVKRDSRGFIGLGGEGRGKVVLCENEGFCGCGEAVGVTTDDGVCVLLCNVAFGVFWTYDEIVCLVDLDSVCDCRGVKLETYSTIGLDKEPVDCQTSRKDLYICVYLEKDSEWLMYGIPREQSQGLMRQERAKRGRLGTTLCGREREKEYEGEGDCGRVISNRSRLLMSYDATVRLPECPESSLAITYPTPDLLPFLYFSVFYNSCYT